MTGAGWTRLLNVGCRTVHLVAVSTLVGGTLWGVDAERLGPSLWLAVGSGLGLVALESQTHPWWLVEGRGLAVIGKLGLLALAPYAGRHQGLLVVAVVILAIKYEDIVSASVPARTTSTTCLANRDSSSAAWPAEFAAPTM